MAHRDVKPQNLHLAFGGGLKLSDFGLAALTEQRGRDGRLRTACGTPSYARGRAGSSSSCCSRDGSPSTTPTSRSCTGGSTGTTTRSRPGSPPFCNHLISLYARCRLPVAARKASTLEELFYVCSGAHVDFVQD
uniref:Protein kinase domain-containing protein n=1 Tax=Ananas comosus var. bracteatus TaxID=296719 RepID=A0A6V7P9V3_ANACO|nr:unnamed protein product [Ananas comosus var. bracteatus]